MVSSIHAIFLKQFISRPMNYWVIAVYSFVLSVFTNQFSYQFIQLQASSTQPASIASVIFSPLNSLSLLLILLLLPLLNLQFKPKRDGSGLSRLVKTYPVPPFRIFLADLNSVLFFMIAVHCLLLITQVPVITSSTTDLAIYITGFGLHALLSITFATMFLTVQQCFRSAISSLIAQYALVVTLWLCYTLLGNSPKASLLSGFNVFASFNFSLQGLIPVTHVIAIVILFLGTLGVTAKALSPKRQSFATVSIALIAICLITLLPFFETYHDITSNQRFSLNPNIKDNISTEEKIKVVTFGLDERARYETQLRLINPLNNFLDEAVTMTHKVASQKENKSGSGLSIETSTTNAWIAYPFQKSPQQILAESIVTAKNRDNQWVLFTAGHQEAELSEQSPRSLSRLAEALKSRGFNFVQAQLREQASIPDNTSLLVIPSSRKPWLDAEKKLLMNYLQTGGNLLWLRDPDDHAFAELESFFGIRKLDGVLMDPVGYQQGTPHPAVLLVDEFNQGPLFESVSSLVALPWASALVNQNSNNQWQYNSELTTHANVWTEFSANAEQLSFDADKGELKGQFPLLWSLQRTQGIKHQKVIIVGDSNFFTNNAIDNYDNKQLALNIMYWLTQSDSTNTAAIDKPVDSYLKLSSVSQSLLGWLNPFVIPGLFILIGVWLWHRKRSR